MKTMIKRSLLGAALLGTGLLAGAMPGGQHRHEGGDAMHAGCDGGKAMKDGGHRGHAMMKGGMHHGGGMMQHRHDTAPQAAPADKAAPAKP